MKIYSIICGIIFIVQSGISAVEHQALLVIDMQQGLLTSSKNRIHVSNDQVDTLIQNVNNTIHYARENSIDIVYIKNIWNSPIRNFFTGNVCNPRYPESNIDSRVLRDGMEFIKNEPSAFSNEQFVRYLSERSVKKMYITGIMAEACVYKTALDAQARGFEIVLIRNAIAGSTRQKTSKSMSLYEQKKLQIDSTIRIR